ncbi:MAG: MlaD family protein [Gemmatimonadaceae bacterium]
MDPRTTWRKLVPGLIAFALLVLFTIGVLKYAGVGKMRGETVKLHVLTDDASGVMSGTEVWLSGQRIGAVDGVGFRPPTGDSLGSIVIAITLRESRAPLVRRNTEATVRAGTSLIGAMVVYLSGGTPDSPAVRTGDTLRTAATTDREIALVKLEGVMDELPPLLAEARTIFSRVHDSTGTVGAFRAGRGSAAGPLSALGANVTTFRQRTAGGGAGVRQVSAHAKRALARVDSIRTLLRSPNSSFGRFRRDSTLRQAIGEVTEELASLQVVLDSADGSLARFQRDRALVNSVAAARREMALLFEDVRRRPLRYLHF